MISLIKTAFRNQRKVLDDANKARITNAYVSTLELLAIIYYNLVSAKTNQSNFVVIMSFQSCCFILSSLLIHHKPMTTNYYNIAILLNLYFQYHIVSTTLDV